jgi:uncharacterized membrane protein
MTKVHDHKSIPGIIASRLLSLICFFLLWFLLNYLMIYVDNDLYRNAVFFLDENAWLIIWMTVIYAAGEIFGALVFPLNLPAPILDAVASVFLAVFLFRILAFVGMVTDEKAFRMFESWEANVYPIVFIAVLIGGYILLFSRLVSKKRKKHKERDD